MNKNTSLTIPHDYEAEQAVLGGIIFDNKLLNEIADFLTPDSFHDENHRNIYRAMLDLSLENTPIDEIILGNRLKEKGKLEQIGGYAYLAELVDCVPSNGNLVYYARIIQEHALLRDLIIAASDISRKGRDPQQNLSDLLREAEEKIRAIGESRRSETVKSLKEVLEDNYETMKKMADSEIKHSLMTEFHEIDKLTGGLYPGDLIIVAARPSMGKSAFALNVAANVAMNPDNSVLIYSLEMQNQKNARRFLSSHGSINPYFLKSGKSNREEDWDQLARSTDRLSMAKIFLNDKTRQIDEMVYNCHSMKRKHGINLIVVDYLQKMEGSGEKTREQEVSKISGKLKNLAMDLDIPVIALCQLNRALENRPDKRPILSDLRESGAIEQDADIILFLYRDEFYYPETTEKKGIAEGILAKVRDGPTGLVELIFEGKYTRFSNKV